MSLAGISIRRPVATTMVMVSFIFIGLLAMFSMKKELIPNINIPVVTITTTWSGAVSEDVESQVTKKIHYGYLDFIQKNAAINSLIIDVTDLDFVQHYTHYEYIIEKIREN